LLVLTPILASFRNDCFLGDTDGCSLATAMISQFAIELGGGLLIGAVMLFAFLKFAFTIEEDPPEATEGEAEVARALMAEARRARAKVDGAPEAELSATGSSVKASVLEQALALRSAHTAGRREDLYDPLTQLSLMYEGMLDSGHQGMLDITEYCNAVSAHPPTPASGPKKSKLESHHAICCWQIVEAEALESLDALQRDDDAELSARATRLFQQVVPRIWAF